MMRFCLLAVALLLPAAAAAQTAIQNVPTPGTYNDGTLKSAADGPPRSLIRLDAPLAPKPLIVADNSHSTNP